MQALMADLELDAQELNCLMDILSHDPNPVLRKVARQRALKMRDRLDKLISELEAANVCEEIQAVLTSVTSTTMQPTVAVPPKKQVGTIVAVEPLSILGEQIKTASSLCSSVSLNDSFRFSGELFNGDSQRMNSVLQQVGEMSSLDAALSFVSSKVKVEAENETMVDFLDMIKKHFN